MQFKYMLTLCAALLLSTVIASPILEETAIVTLYERAVTPQYRFTGDLANIVIPAPLPPGSPPKAVKAQNAKIARAKARQVEREKSQHAASARVGVVLAAASSPLHLAGTLPVTVTNDFHTSSDPESHATFEFNAPVCHGTCVGHAYNPVSHNSPGKGQPGKIFDATHHTIFGANDV